MLITRVESWSVQVEQETPYSVAYGDFGATTLVFLRLETDRGLIGHGCAGCDTEVTGETAETVRAALAGNAEPILRGTNPLCVLSLLRELGDAVGAQPSALAAVDLALFDILGKHVELPLWKWLGGRRDRIPTSVTIGILPENETVAAARQWIAQGFTSLKLKGGRDVESDITRVWRVHEAVGPDIELRFDANQGYSVEQALHFARQTQSARLEFLEQPTPSDRPELLGQVRAARLIPVMADESLHGPDRAFHLTKHELVDMFNVKLMKSGGIAPALRIEAIARSAGLPIMVGCMDESALGIAAGLHFALSSPTIQYADLDGHLGLVGDPAAGGLRLENGILFSPEKPGLGIEPRHD
jgi:L-alanine-DL-glutamate epimerase-like enolase superfamily enzyme